MAMSPRTASSGWRDLIDEDLANWVSEHVAFPNGMVDRITPATTDRERGILAKDFGLEDNWPVFCEPFRQWVLEDHFTDGRPPLEKVGVQFVKDVAPYRTDEDPHPQWRPRDDRLSGRPDGHPFRP
jgi:mannitol-1-phosphate/altronate dehydrogenase